MEPTEEDELIPPSVERVASRALVLAAVACRGLIEKEKEENVEGAEKVRQRLLPWLDRIGVTGELEPTETSALSTAVGHLDRRATIDASWRAEGLAVLAWALHYATLPQVSVLSAPVEIANAIGFLQDRQQTAISSPRLRSYHEIEYWAHTYLTLHWRLREFSLKPGTMDFVSFAMACKWTKMELGELEIRDKDLAINGVRIDHVDKDTFRDVVSITTERRIALDWLLGFAALYSDVTTDT
jgi:Domain of unknown function (DUF4272)